MNAAELAELPADTSADAGAPVAHIVLVRDHVPGAVIEALCGHKFIPQHNPDGRPVCPACMAVYSDTEARALAAGYR